MLDLFADFYFAKNHKNVIDSHSKLWYHNNDLKDERTYILK